MTLRQLFLIVVFAGVVFVHAFAQSSSWRAHLGRAGLPAALPAHAEMWEVYSFPAFHVTPRRLHHVYFQELMMLNSALWGIGAATLAALLLRAATRHRR